jgi:leucyl aminopeptidase
MQIVHQTLSVAVTAGPARDIDADLLVFPVLDDDDLADEPDLDQASGGEISAARRRGEFKGKPYELFITTVRGWKAPRVALVGLGSRKEFAIDRLRRAASTAGLAARQRGMTRMAIVVHPGAHVSPADAAQALAEGAFLANFETASYKTVDPPRVWLDSVTLRVGGDANAVDRGAERGRVLGECTNLARELANEPSNTLTPRVFAERAAGMAREAGLAVDVLDEKRIAELKMGLLLGVAQGSAEPPRLVVLRHEPKSAAAQPVLGLIGKGITFDTGGISIKPAENMDKMKDDMSGGAAVLAAMCAISRLRAPVRCIGMIPMTENMPGGKAMKPGDVLTSAAGTTVEVVNTDAEGRLVLGDALWYARRAGATHLVDVAALTGACAIALGKHASALFAEPDDWGVRVRRAGDLAGDRLWPMPLFDEYFEQLKSETADLLNTGGRYAGAVTAALFLKQFAGDGPWAHLDIAGTSWLEEPKAWQSKGATGVGTRTLVELARSLAAA